jgi:hypothetical protein
MSFDQKIAFDRHKNRKVKCKINGGSKSMKILEHKCNYCKKKFSRKDSLNRHFSTCKVKNKKINNKKTKNIMVNGNDNISIPGNNNIALNKSTIHVNLIVFAKDGIKNISPKDLAKIIGSKNNVIESIISNVNLNPDKPQHHNIYYGDTKSSYGEVYENNTWIRKKIDEILETLIEAKIGDLNEILNDMSDFLNQKAIKKIKETIENMDYTRPGARKKLKAYLKPIIYNHKDMIIKTRKLSKKQIEQNFKKEQDEAELEAQEEENKLRKYSKNNNF